MYNALPFKGNVRLTHDSLTHVVCMSTLITRLSQSWANMTWYLNGVIAGISVSNRFTERIRVTIVCPKQLSMQCA